MVGPGHPYETHSPIWATTRNQKFDYGPPAPWAATLMDAIRSQMLGPGQPYKARVAVLSWKHVKPRLENLSNTVVKMHIK